MDISVEDFVAGKMLKKQAAVKSLSIFISKNFFHFLNCLIDV